MPAPEWFGPLPISPGYVGPGPGMEFLPYALALLGWAAAALIAVLQWPFAALFRRLTGRHEPAPAPTAGQPDVPGEAGHDHQ